MKEGFKTKGWVETCADSSSYTSSLSSGQACRGLAEPTAVGPGAALPIREWKGLQIHQLTAEKP